MTTEVDLLDVDGVIISIAAVDDTFWANNAVQATAYAAQKGLGIYVPGGAPAVGSAERNVGAWGDFTTWVGSQYTNLSRPPSAPSSSKIPIVVGLAAAAALALATIYVSTRSTKRSR